MLWLTASWATKTHFLREQLKHPPKGSLCKDITDCRSCLLFRMRPSQTLLPAVMRWPRSASQGHETRTGDDGMARHRFGDPNTRTTRSPRRPSAAHASAVVLACAQWHCAPFTCKHTFAISDSQYFTHESALRHHHRICEIRLERMTLGLRLLTFSMSAFWSILRVRSHLARLTCCRLCRVDPRAATSKQEATEADAWDDEPVNVEVRVSNTFK